MSRNATVRLVDDWLLEPHIYPAYDPTAAEVLKVGGYHTLDIDGEKWLYFPADSHFERVQ